jgi:poly[(R)-3-hydroxyalkanoate] polymerase subunit PhaC
MTGATQSFASSRHAWAVEANPYSLQPWMALAFDWQQAMQAWMRWWTSGFGAEQRVRAQGEDGRGVHVAATHMPDIPFDAHALSALHASFRPRFDHLWKAATQALSQPGGKMPEIVSEPPGDRRFSAAIWRDQPYFSWIRQAYLLYAEYLLATAALAKLPPPEKRRLEFSMRQFVDAISPTNFPATNPEVLERALATEGVSVLEGFRHFSDDVRKGRITMTDEAAFEIGRNIAVTPGGVVFRNPLIELIQYDATTANVAKRPLVMVPPCINKYYILDLRPDNSFVRHAVAQGHTVFMISWRNIPPELAHLSWDDYLEQGVLAAVDAAREISGSRTVNALGFCVGGTLLASTLAVLAARKSKSIASVTFLTTMLDFRDPGEIGVYISREALAAREPVLMRGQRVHGSELAGAFASLRPNDLVWNYVVNNYLKGRTPPAFDLLYWNGDSSNLPGPMYAYYLKNLYLENRLRERNALTMLGERIDLAQVAAPAYVYASREDHIVPWRSAFRTVELLGGDTTFVLGASGHIAGVVNPPHSGKRNYWTNDAHAASADAWLETATSHPGSWWPHWYRWLARHKGGERTAPGSVGNAHYPILERAPGGYVREQVA